MGALEGRVALVTGSSRGIGRAVALDLARNGADVVVNCRSRTDLAREVAEQVEAVGRRALIVQADVGDALQSEDLVRETLEVFGRLDVLVNNAGIWRGGLLEQVDYGVLERLIDTNLKGAFYVTKPALAPMKENGWGRIVNISSVLGVKGFPGDTIYSATKAAMLGFTRSLARELARENITVNAVAPGFIETDMAYEVGQGVRSRILKTIPMRRWGTAEEVADLVTFLAAKGDYITGQLFTVDGGFTI